MELVYSHFGGALSYPGAAVRGMASRGPAVLRCPLTPPPLTPFMATVLSCIPVHVCKLYCEATATVTGTDNMPARFGALSCHPWKSWSACLEPLTWGALFLQFAANLVLVQTPLSR